MANNVAFGAMAFVVLLGTVFPLLIEAWDGTRLTIGRPYFDSMARPIAMVILFLMASAPVLPWRKASTEVLSVRLFWPAMVAVASMAVALVFGARGLYPVLTFGLGGFAAGAALRQVVLATRRQGWRGLLGRTNGGMIVHLGVVLLAVGLAASEAYKSERTVALDVGETATVEGHEFRYLEPGADINDRRLRVFAAIEIDGDKINHPAVTNFRRTGETVPTPSVRSGFTKDIFLVLATSPDPDDDSIDLRVVIRPMVAWIWTGGILMAVGTALALFPGRRRRGTEPTSSGLDATPDPVPPISDATRTGADGHQGDDAAGGPHPVDQPAGDEIDRKGAGV